MKDCVVRLAFVMPNSSGSAVAGVCFFFDARSRPGLLTVDVFALKELRVPRLLHHRERCLARGTLILTVAAPIICENAE